MRTLILFTHNNGKLKEANEIGKRFGVRLVMPKNADKFEIQADTVAEISRYAAKHAYEKIKKPLIVDDSGLFIKALKGFPGAYSHQVKTQLDLDGILKLMDGVRDRRAYFECAATFCNGKTTKTFTGRINGNVAFGKWGEGTSGFGFDPIITPAGSSKTLSELGSAYKNRHSHRARAFMSFFRWYSEKNRA